QGGADLGRPDPHRSALRAPHRHGAFPMSAVPTIDISKRDVAGEVARTCEQTGFLIISGHGFPLELLQRAQRELLVFFDLPLETKSRWHPTGPSRQRGYHGFAT